MVVDWFNVVATVAEIISLLCRIDAELSGVGLSKLAVTTLFPVLTRTYGRLRIVRGMVVPELEIVDVCDEGTTIGVDIVSSDGEVVATNPLAFFRIIWGEVCWELPDEKTLFVCLNASTLIFDDAGWLTYV